VCVCARAVCVCSCSCCGTEGRVYTGSCAKITARRTTGICFYSCLL